LDLDDFEEFVLYNLSENIKEGNDEAGLGIAKISLFIKYAKSHGRRFFIGLEEGLKDKAKKELFESECLNHYLEAKQLILNLKDVSE
jgi:hypothetical protein